MILIYFTTEARCSIIEDMAEYSFVAIIYNPNSTGNSRQAAEDLAAFVRKRKIDLKIKLVPTRHAGHAEELAYDIAKKYGGPLIISSSGDGGYHEVINGAMRAQAEGAKPICAVLPAGNANDHHHDVSSEPLPRAVIRGRASRIDLLKVEVTSGKDKTMRYGHSYLGLGLTPTVAIELNRHSLSALKELSIVLRSFYRFRPFQIEVGDRIVTLDSLVISNIGRMAKVLSLERSDLDDGIFEVTIFPHGHKMQLLRKLLIAATKGLRPDERVKQYEFTARKAMPMQIDGEVTTLRPGDKVKVSGAQRQLRTLG